MEGRKMTPLMTETSSMVGADRGRAIVHKSPKQAGPHHRGPAASLPEGKEPPPGYSAAFRLGVARCRGPGGCEGGAAG